jgi:putative Mg2+ transporter-C (MgtC) family protein
MSLDNVNEWTAVLRVFGSALLGGAVGWDREARHKSSAGIRTHMMVGAGSRLFAVTAVLAFSGENQKADDAGVTYLAQNPDRILAGIATGVGFLGGGAIIRTDENVKGLTTAAGLWTVAGVGAAVAYGQWVLASMAAALAVFIEVSDIFFVAVHDVMVKRRNRANEESHPPELKDRHGDATDDASSDKRKVDPIEENAKP